MIKPTLSLTESQTLVAVRSFALAVMGSDGVAVEVIKGQENRVAAPDSDDYVVMTTMLGAMLETNTTTFHDGAFDTVPGDGLRMDLMPRDVTVQLDFHGPNSYDLCLRAQGMARTEYAVDIFKASGFDVTPLYANDPHQSGFSNGEQQIENTWILDLHVQCNPILTTGQDFADELAVGLIEIEARYPVA